MRRLLFLPLLFSPLLAICQTTPLLPLEAGVSLQLAEARATRIKNLGYELFFNIPASSSAPISAQAMIQVDLSSTDIPLIVDYKAPAAYIKRVVANKRTVPIDFREGHIVVASKYLLEGRNTIQITFTAGDMSLNRAEDYLYTLLVPDRASTAFPCFDQPDLKARYRLKLEIPAHWEAVGNGALERTTARGSRKQVEFKETLPFSTYLFAFAAGKFRKSTDQRAGRQMTMYFRETNEAKVGRNVRAIFDLHAQAIQWMEEYTQIPFPFDKLDFVCLPGFQYGGMEHVGNIFYSEPSMFIDEAATENQKLGRARLIAHETAHMWFGDLVTMKWFNDVWLKEVFANFMAAKAVNPSFPNINHDLSFMLGHQPTAYSEDRSGGTHPIQQPLENLKDAGSLYGGIIYQKAPVVMRQLEALIGPDIFRQGLQQYLKTFAYKNATWDDLIQILDNLSPQDLSTWSKTWVKEAGMPVIRTEWTATGKALQQIALIQEKQSNSGSYWTQHTTIALVYANTVRTIPCQINGMVSKPIIPEGTPTPLAIFANGSAMSYGYFKLDPVSSAYLLSHVGRIADPVLRGAAWMALYETLVHENISPNIFLRSVLDHLPTEKEALNRQNLLGYLNTVYWQFLRPQDRALILPEMEDLLWKYLDSSELDISTRAAYYNAYLEIAGTKEATEKLFALWSGAKELTGLPFSEKQKITLAETLALLIPEQADSIVYQQLANTQNPDNRKKLLFIQPALSPKEAVRDSFFNALKLVSNRSVEPWVTDAVGYLNHPLRAGVSEKYILPSLELLEEIQQTGDIFFPRRFITAVLSGHQSPKAAQIVRDFLHTHPEFPYRLRNKTLMAADMLFRVEKL